MVWQGLERSLVESKQESDTRAHRLVARSVDLKLMLHRCIREKEAAEMELAEKVGSVELELEWSKEMTVELQVRLVYTRVPIISPRSPSPHSAISLSP